MGGSDIYAAPAILDADATARLSLLGALRLPSLCLQGSPAAPLCGEERCAGSFWTNGVRGDASKTLASVLRPLAKLRSFIQNEVVAVVSQQQHIGLHCLGALETV